MRKSTAADTTSVDRRAVLLGGAAASATLATGYNIGSAFAQASPHTFKVGAAEVTVLSDGALTGAWSFVLPDRPPAEITAAGQPLPEFRLQYNVTLIRLGAELILVDTGSGPDFAPARGKLTDNLDKAGIKPEAITRVVFTHAHPDHLWGVVDPLDGGSLFPKARHTMTAVERDFWLNPDTPTRVPESARGSAGGTQRRIKELGDRIEPMKVGAEIVPGLAAIDSAGHTPGHVCLLLTSGSEKLMIGGDALTEPVISFARPEWRWAPDWDQDMAVTSRKRLLDMLTTDRIPLVGYHLPWPGVGRVERSGTGYRFAQT